MNRLKILLFALAALSLVAAFFLGTTDRFAGSQNCGAALFPKDTEQLVQSGDPIDDDFESEVVRDQCSQELLRQRIFTGLFVVLAIGLAVAAVRVEPRPSRFPGDPIV